MKHIISIDVEVSGRIPGEHSMLQLGAVAFNMKGVEVSKFCMNLQPLSAATGKSTMDWWATQSKEAWEKVTSNPKPSVEVCKKFVDWMAQFPKPVLYAAPVMFDGAWLRWYLEKFVGESGSHLFHRALDARSVVWALTGYYEGDWKARVAAITECEIVNPSPHYALADAREQGLYLFALMKWNEKQKGK